jgi:hypothetical protein
MLKTGQNSENASSGEPENSQYLIYNSSFQYTSKPILLAFMMPETILIPL